ncbi:uncharacterized protein LOC128336293 isoform X3 [Hemicordylus capensis]|uniref:uncharacterized protein LOC128336293 isoform X3 n=1 Tax=Hemicordylus capensis TaxID=884348 RepID=UPI0023044B07|nr:uncharacterized protein LOC128336293 isoform X3 [Hemicordylus capensis]
MRAELGPAPLPLPSPLPPLPSPSPPPLFPLSPSPSSSSPTFILSSSPLSSFLPFLLPLQSVTEERAGCFASIVLEPEQLLLAFWASAAFSRRSDPCMSVTQAMEWLIEERDNRIVDAPLPGQLLLGNSAEAGTSSSTTTTTKAVAGASLEASREELKDELTELFKKIRRKREFRADPQAVIALMEMGYDEREVVDALRGNNHQQNTVCEWLLGDRKPTPEDVDQGIDPSSPLFQAILENPVVQLRLTNPKTLLAKRNGVGACVPMTHRPECCSWSICSSPEANVAETESAHVSLRPPGRSAALGAFSPPKGPTWQISQKAATTHKPRKEEKSLMEEPRGSDTQATKELKEPMTMHKIAKARAVFPTALNALSIQGPSVETSGCFVLSPPVEGSMISHSVAAWNETRFMYVTSFRRLYSPNSLVKLDIL